MFKKRTAGVGYLKSLCKECNLCGKLSTRDLFIIYVRRSGNRVPERGCILENQILRFPRAIVPDKCNASCDLALLFSWQARYFGEMGWRNRKTHWHRGGQFCAQLVSFEGSLSELLRL